MLGPAEIGLLAFLVLLFFGGKLLPQLGRGVGDTIKELRQGVREDDP